MTTNEKIPIPRTREPDLLDELARWLPLVFKVCNVDEPLFLRPADNASALTAAEKAVSDWELIQKGQAIVCDRPARCEHHRCRRRKLCGRLEKIATTLAVVSARLAAERAKWQPPPAPAEPPRSRKKGRTAVRP